MSKKIFLNLIIILQVLCKSAAGAPSTAAAIVIGDEGKVSLNNVYKTYQTFEMYHTYSPEKTIPSKCKEDLPSSGECNMSLGNWDYCVLTTVYKQDRTAGGCRISNNFESPTNINTTSGQPEWTLTFLMTFGSRNMTCRATCMRLGG